MRKSNELGFIEEDIDLGFIDDAPNLTTPIIPAVNPLELQIETERDEKEISLRKEFMAKVKQEKADADPENWTLRQVQDHLKINPPLSLPEEAQWQGLIMKKKRQIKQMMEKQYPQSEILNAPPKSIQDAVLAVVMKPFQQTPAEKNAHAQNIYALSKVYDLPVKTVTKNYEALAAEIFGRDLKPIELASIAMMGPLTAALVVHPAAVVLKGLGVGLAAFQAVTEVENGVVSKVKKENYRFLRGRNIAELLPAEANQGTKDMVEMLSFIGKGFAAAGITGITKYGPGLVSRFTKDVVMEYQLPKSLYMPADAIKSTKTGNIGQSIDNLKDIGIGLSKGDRARVFKAFYQGKQVQIEVPSEVVVKLVDKPIWARIKDTLHIKPYEKVLKIIGREDNQFVGVSLCKLTGPANEGQRPGGINIPSGEIEPVLASKLAAPPAAGGMTGKGIPEQVSKWLEKGVSITEGQGPGVINISSGEIEPVLASKLAAQPAAGGILHDLTPIEQEQLKTLKPAGVRIVNLTRDIEIDAGKAGIKSYKKGEDIYIYQDPNTGKAIVKDGDYGILPKKAVAQVEAAGVLLGEKVSPPESQVEEVVKGGISMPESMPKFSKWQLPGGENYKENTYFTKNHPVEPEENHFDDAATWNRTNDRITQDGKKILFIEEIQKNKNLDKSLNNPLAKGKYVEFNLKKILQKAIAEGYDGISWTTEEQQAQRWDLNKQVDSIKIFYNADGTYDITGMKNGDIIIPRCEAKDIPVDKLENYIDKGLAEKVINKIDGKWEGDGLVYKGLSLKLGGKWAENLYGRQIPNILKDITKGQISTVNLRGQVPLSQTGRLTVDELATYKKGGLLNQPALMFTPEVKSKLIGQPAAGGQVPEIPKETQVEAEAQKEPVLAAPTGEGKVTATHEETTEQYSMRQRMIDWRDAGWTEEQIANQTKLLLSEVRQVLNTGIWPDGAASPGALAAAVIPPQEPVEFAPGEYAKQYEQDYLGQYDELSPEDRARFDLEMDDLRNRPEANLLVAIRKLGKIKIERNAAGGPSERFKDLPASIKDKNSSQTLDGIRTELETFGWYFDDEAEFFDAIKTAAVNQEKPADRAELRRIIREAEKNKKLQQIINDKFKKTRKFIKTVKQSEKTAPEVAAKVKSLYDPITNAETLKQAQEYIAASPEDALQLVEGPGKPTAFSNAVAIVLIDKAQAEGRYSDAIRLVEKTAEKQTSLGQAIQALSMYNRLTPEGILQAAAKIVREGREAITQKDRLTKFDKQSEKLTDKEKAVLAKRLGVPFLSEEEAAKIHDMAVKMADWPDPPPFDAPPANAYQYWIDEFTKLLDTPEGLSVERKQALQLTFDEFRKILPDTGDIGPGQQGYQFVIDEFQKLLPDTGDEMGPVTEGVQEVMNIASQRISRAKRLETLLLQKRLQSLVPPSLGKKIAMVQTLSQLLNPKTIIRNIFGNLGFMGLENISDTIGTAIDMAACKFTGERTQYLPSGAAQVKGGIQGIKESTEEALLGVSLSKHGTKFDLPANGIYDKGVMGALEKTLRLVLAMPDQAFFQAAFNQSIYNDVKAAGITEPTDEMLERAVLLGLYRTYQDDSVIAKQFVRLKKWMNDWTGGDFGFGDMIIKYPKTPANIISRGIEYSPFSLIKAIHYLAEPLIGRDFKQGDFVKASSRGFTGSALLVGVGAFLASIGIVSGKRAKDKDVEATRANVGIREYQLNASALKRFVMSGMDPEQSKIKEDDIHVTYDWFQPQSIGLALGANMVLDPKSNLVDRTLNLGDRLLAASETLQEQPLMQGMRVLTSRENIAQGLSDVAKGAPASMMPTLLNQIKQLTDNTVRNTKDPNFLKEVYNKIIVRIPGLSYTLPPRITTLGQERAAYQFGSNNPFNVFLNPAFVTTYKPDPVSKMVLDIWESTGETIHFPRVAAVKIKLGGNTAEPAELTPEQYTEYQKYIGCRTDVLFSILAEKPEFMELPDDQKAKVLQGYLTDINSAAKKNILMLGYRPETDTLTILKSIGRDKRKLDALGVPDENLGFIEKK